MKKSSWMSESGHQGGERAERLNQQALRSRQRKSLETLGLALPFPVWLVLFLIYLVGLGILGFVPGDVQTLRGFALAVNMFIMGIFCAFKFPLWVPKH